MKKNSICLILALLCVWLPVFVGFRYSQQIRNILPALIVQVWDKDKPAASTSLRNSNPEMLANQAALESAIAQDHEFSTGGTNSGKHEVITFEEESSAGASSTNEGHLQVIDGGSQPEMAFTSEDGDQLQFTKDGDLFSSDGLVVTEASTFNGSITLGAGDDLIGSATSDIAFNTNKFTVAGATGNTVVAGTLGVAGVATLGDGSLLATSAAPSTDAMIANKLYVDTKEDTIVTQATASLFGARTQNDTTPAAITKTVVYRAECDGILTITHDHSIDAVVQCLTDNANPPTTVLGQYATASITDKKMTLTIPVRKLDYVKVTVSPGDTPDFYWTPFGTGGLVDQTP